MLNPNQPLKMGKIVDSRAHGNKLDYVRIQLVDPTEITIFRQFLEDERIETCPKCGATNHIGEDDYVIQIDDPLNDQAGLHLGLPIMQCDNCGTKFSISLLDYTAFPSIVSLITTLRVEYQRMKEKRHGDK